MGRCLPIHLQLLCREIRVQRRLLQYLQNYGQPVLQLRAIKIVTNAVTSVLQTNVCAGEWAGDAARVECNEKIESFMREFRGDFNDMSARQECCTAAGVCC